MTIARALIRSESLHTRTISQILNLVNPHLALDVYDTGRFMNLFYATFDLIKQSLQWVRAGHDPAIFYDSATDSYTELKGPGLALGVDSGWKY